MIYRDTSDRFSAMEADLGLRAGQKDAVRAVARLRLNKGRSRKIITPDGVLLSLALPVSVRPSCWAVAEFMFGDRADGPYRHEQIRRQDGRHQLISMPRHQSAQNAEVCSPSSFAIIRTVLLLDEVEGFLFTMNIFLRHLSEDHGRTAKGLPVGCDRHHDVESLGKL